MYKIKNFTYKVLFVDNPYVQSSMREIFSTREDAIIAAVGFTCTQVDHKIGADLVQIEALKGDIYTLTFSRDELEFEDQVRFIVCEIPQPSQIERLRKHFPKAAELIKSLLGDGLEDKGAHNVDE